MNQPIKFVHRKEFATGSGLTITMKALVTIHGVQYVECYEDNMRYPVSQLVAVSTATGN
jgi:hypothetical protein